MLNKKRAKKSVQFWKHSAKAARESLMNGEPMDFTDFVHPRVKQQQATERLKNSNDNGSG